MYNLEFNKNEDSMKLFWKRIRKLGAEIEKGGGEKAAAKQKEKGKMLARERIEYLKDDNAPFYEIGLFAGYDMYKEHGGCPAGGVVGGITYIGGRQCIVVANDATVKAGAWFPITAKKTFAFRK